MSCIKRKVNLKYLQKGKKEFKADEDIPVCPSPELEGRGWVWVVFEGLVTVPDGSFHPLLLEEDAGTLSIQQARFWGWHNILMSPSFSLSPVTFVNMLQFYFDIKSQITHLRLLCVNSTDIVVTYFHILFDLIYSTLMPLSGTSLKGGDHDRRGSVCSYTYIPLLHSP